MEQIKAYKPENNSVGSGQVLQCAYTSEKARLIVKEMTDLLVLDLVDKCLVTDQLTLTVGYDIDNIRKTAVGKPYRGEIKTDRYGRQIPKHAHGTVNLDRQTSSTKKIMAAVLDLYDRIIDPTLMVRRIYVTAARVVREDQAEQKESYQQLDLFTDYKALEIQQQKEKEQLAKEKNMQKAMLDIKKKFGKNAILKGMNLEEGAMTRERNRQIGGHRE